MSRARIKEDRYRRIFEQLELELSKSPDPVARMATTAALLHHKQTHFFWTGFYRLQPDGSLLVGPYQGTLACQVLPPDQGVCGAALRRGETVVVQDVGLFPGHIACDARTRSEVVVPYRGPDGSPQGVLDVDSTKPSDFDDLDAEWLEKIVQMLFRPLGSTPRKDD